MSLFLLEALLCLCGTRRGRTELRRLKAYAVVQDCDYRPRRAAAPTRASEAPSEKLLVTADDAPEPPRSRATEELTLKRRGQGVGADLAAMLLRDEAGPRGPPDLRPTWTEATDRAAGRYAGRVARRGLSRV